MNINIKHLNKRKCIIVAITFLILILMLIFNSEKLNYDDLSIMLNNEFIELKNVPIIDEDENILFSLDDVQNLFDKTIYYNEIDEILITTGNKHIATLKIDNKDAEIDDNSIELNGLLQIKDDIVYVPISDLANVYDLEMYFSKRSNRIIIDSLNNEKIEVTVRQKTSLKNGKGIFSKRIESLVIGDKLVVLETNGSFKIVRSPLGNIGYVKTNKLSEDEKIRDDVKYEKIEIVPYFNYSNSSGIYNDIDVDRTKRNVILPDFFSIEKEDKLLDKTNITSATYAVYKKWAENNGLEILPSIVNSENISDCLLTYEQRSKIINELKDKLLEYGFWGININFKTIDDFNSFYRFIIELVPRFKENDLKIVVTINNNNIERNRIEKQVDCIIEE